MKKRVIGSRRTVMNSLKRIAFRPRKGARFMRPRFAQKLQVPNPKLQRSSKSQAPNCSRCALLLVFAGVFRGEGDEDVFERRANLVDLGAGNSDAAQLFVDLLLANGFVHQKVHRLAEYGRI